MRCSSSRLPRGAARSERRRCQRRRRRRAPAGPSCLRAALIAGHGCGMLVAPGSLLVLRASSVIVAALLAVAVATLAMPAALAVLGTGVNCWPVRRLAARRRVAAAGGAHAAAGRASPRSPSSCRSRCSRPCGRAEDRSAERREPAEEQLRAQELRGVRAAAGRLVHPYEVVFHAKGPITTTQRLRALGRFQNRVAAERRRGRARGRRSCWTAPPCCARITRDVTSGQKQVKRLEGGLKRTRNGNRAAARRPCVRRDRRAKARCRACQAAAGSQQLNRA